MSIIWYNYYIKIERIIKIMPKKKSKSSRTLSPEQIKKMQDGRKKKQMLKNREESIKNLEHRLYIGSHK
jgi:hypothetical protein